MPPLSMHTQSGNDLVFVNKPAGLSTHAPNPETKGMAELVEAQIGRKIYVVHRLDKTTTGCLALATNEKRAQQLFSDFQQKRVKKRYLLLTDRKSYDSPLTIHSEIQKVGKLYQNNAASAHPNATTHFKLIKQNANCQLWQAEPETGKSHQIRLHAAQAGLPILGDTLYGGSPYPHLCLHAAELEIPGENKLTWPAPVFFERMGLLCDEKLIQILSALDRRQRIYNFLSQRQSCLRLSHLDHTDFRIDLYGPVLWIYWYKPQDPSPQDLQRFEFVAGLASKKYLLRKMQNRGADPNSQTDWKSPDLPTEWTAQENDIQFQFRSNQGLSPGLFLDQRGNRELIRSLSQDKSVLNLFSYTGGFSVAAALGGAKSVTTVDLSSKFLQWSRENFKLNGINPDQNQFFAQDALPFLEKTCKMNKKFDIVICDPPSFSRSEKGVFKIESDFTKLITLCWQVLAPGGKLLFASNFEKWSAQEFKLRMAQALKISAAKIEAGVQNLDFELPSESPLMKSFLISKDPHG